MQNIGTLSQRSPMFSLFRPQNRKKHGKTAIKPNCAEFAIFRTEGSHGGFRCPSRAIISPNKNKKTSIRKRRAEKLHTHAFSAPRNMFLQDFTDVPAGFYGIILLRL